MALLDNQVQLYLALQGHMPEMFLITEIFGRSEQEARKILRWRDQEMLKYHPATMAIRLVAERARLRNQLGLPPVDNEEATIYPEGTKIQQLTGQVRISEDGEAEVSGTENLPPALQAMIKNELIRKLREQKDHRTGIASFDQGEDKPGTVQLPDGRVMQFGSLREFMEFIAGGGFKPQEEEDGTEDD